MFVIAEKLGKTIEEIEFMTMAEYNEWVAYFNMSQEMANGVR